MKAKDRKNRATLAKVIDREESFQTRQDLAKYGQKPPALLYFVNYWYSRFLPNAQGKREVKLTDIEREFLLNELLHGIVTLNVKWFADMTEAVRFYRAHRKDTVDPVRLKLNDLEVLWRQHGMYTDAPPLTAKELKFLVKYNGDDAAFRRLLKRMGIPFKKTRS